MQRNDILEAFSHHPQIGADMESLRQKFATTATWSAGEQGSIAVADEDTLENLADGNREYLAKFGHIFIVCALRQIGQRDVGVVAGAGCSTIQKSN